MTNKDARILISGGCGNLATELKRHNKSFTLFTPSRNEMNVNRIEDIEKKIKSVAPNYFLHAAAVTRPMSIHEASPAESIKTNIIGTCNVSLMCIKHGIKLIYISTDYVYGGTKGNYKEVDGAMPFTAYGWSKLGGECAVNMCPDHLILRAAMTESPFPHPKALTDMKKSSIYAHDVAKIIFKLMHHQGTMNIGGKNQSVFNFAKQSNSSVGKITLNEIKDVNMAVDCSMDTSIMRIALQNNE